MSDTNTVPRNPDGPVRTMGRTDRERGQGGRFLPTDARPEPEVIPEDFKPVRIWTGGPGSVQEAFLIPGTTHKIRPRVDGSYLLTSPRQVEAARKAFGEQRYWPDNIPEDADSMRCDTCNWTTRSWNAFQWHSNHAHGREQTR